jgi:hypothetical protein
MRRSSVPAAWTRGHGGKADPTALAAGLRLGFAGAAALAALGIGCALTMLPRTHGKPDQAVTPRGNTPTMSTNDPH